MAPGGEAYLVMDARNALAAAVAALEGRGGEVKPDSLAKIRERVERVRLEHRSGSTWRPEQCLCGKANEPCPARSLANDLLTACEMLWQIREECWNTGAGEERQCDRIECWAVEVLEKIGGGKE
jgi:hypothetical protein